MASATLSLRPWLAGFVGPDKKSRFPGSRYITGESVCVTGRLERSGCVEANRRRCGERRRRDTKVLLSLTTCTRLRGTKSTDCSGKACEEGPGGRERAQLPVPLTESQSIRDWKGP